MKETMDDDEGAHKMMENRYLQDLQEAFAAANRLNMVIVDRSGSPVTNAASLRGLPGLIFREEAVDWQSALKKHASMLQCVRAATIYDYNTYLGLKYIVVPVPVDGAYPCYIWAGAWLDETSRAAAARSVDRRKRGAAAILRELERLPDLEEVRRERLMEKLDRMAGIVAALVRDRSRKLYETSALRIDLKAIGEWEASPNDPDSEARTVKLLKELAGFELAGFARKSSAERYAITALEGLEPPALLLGAEFHTGEGCLGQAALVRQRVQWDSSACESRMAFFAERGIRLESLVAYPLLVGGEPAGVLFGGSFREGRPGSGSLDLAELVMKLWGGRLNVAELTETRRRRLAMFDSLNEGAQLMAAMRETKHIASLVVDLAQQAAGGGFVCFLLRSGPDQMAPFQLMSRGMTQEQANTFLRDAREYDWQSRPSWGPAVRGPVYRVTGWGEQAAEFPLYVGHQMIGLLAVGVREQQDEPELFFLGAIALICEKFLLELRQPGPAAKRSHLELLHRTAAKWNPQAYREGLLAAKLAGEFARALSLPAAALERIDQAGLVVAYDSAYLWETIPWHDEIVFLLQEAEELAKQRSGAYPGGGSPFKPFGFTRESQVLALAKWRVKLEAEPSEPTPLVEHGLIEAFERFLRERAPFSRTLTPEELAGAASPQPAAAEPKKPKELALPLFTPREQEVLELVTQGCTNQDIAKRLYISSHTVKNHLTKIYMKLGVDDRAGAMVKLLRPVHV